MLASQVVGPVVDEVREIASQNRKTALQVSLVFVTLYLSLLRQQAGRFVVCTEKTPPCLVVYESNPHGLQSCGKDTRSAR